MQNLLAFPLLSVLKWNSIFSSWTQKDSLRKRHMTTQDIWILHQKTNVKMFGGKSACFWNRWAFIQKALTTKKAPDKMKLTSVTPIDRQWVFPC